MLQLTPSPHNKEAEALTDTIERFERMAGDFRPAAARKQALRFHPRRFDEEITGFLAALGFGGATPLRRAA